VANPKFVLPWSEALIEFRIQSHTSNLLNLVWFTDLKFLNVDAMEMTGTSTPPHERTQRVGFFGQRGIMDWKFLLTSFDGRINRAKFWAGIGVMFAMGVVAEIIDLLLDLHLGQSGVGLVSFFYTLAAIYFLLAVYAKRWHDRDKSGWWSLIVLVPVIGSLWILIELGILEGTRGSNRYGPDPLA
jgi:uncharacterized membrane protein YhaH (DUF805 family)